MSYCKKGTAVIKVKLRYDQWALLNREDTNKQIENYLRKKLQDRIAKEI